MAYHTGEARGLPKAAPWPAIPIAYHLFGIDDPCNVLPYLASASLSPWQPAAAAAATEAAAAAGALRQQEEREQPKQNDRKGGVRLRGTMAMLFRKQMAWGTSSIQRTSPMPPSNNARPHTTHVPPSNLMPSLLSSLQQVACAVERRVGPPRPRVHLRGRCEGTG